MITTLFRLQQFASLRRLWIAGLVAVLLFASGNAAFGQASKKSPSASNNAIRPASSPRVATNDAPNPKAVTQAAAMTIERVNELTGFEPASEEEVKLLVEKMQRAIAEKDTSGLRECFDERRLTVRQFPATLPCVQCLPWLLAFWALSLLRLRLPDADLSDSSFRFSFAKAGFQVLWQAEAIEQTSASVEQHVAIHKAALVIKNPCERTLVAIEFR